jgi:hypothetical protein
LAGHGIGTSLSMNGEFRRLGSKPLSGFWSLISGVSPGVSLLDTSHKLTLHELMVMANPLDFPNWYHVREFVLACDSFYFS